MGEFSYNPSRAARSGAEPMRATRIPWFAFALGFLTFVALTRVTVEDVLFSDIAEFQVIGLTGGLAHANGYPVYVTLLNLWVRIEVGEPAWRTSVFSALAAAAAVSLLALCTVRLTRSHAAGVVAGTAFALSTPLWVMGTVALPYTLDACFTLAVLLSVLVWEETNRARWLSLAFFLWGLNYGVHPGAVLLAPGIAILMVSVLASRSLAPGKSERWIRVVGPDLRAGSRTVPGQDPGKKVTPALDRVKLLILHLAVPIVVGLGGVALCLLLWFFQDSRHVVYDCLRFYGWTPPDTWVPSLDTPLERLVYQVGAEADHQMFFTKWRIPIAARIITREAVSAVGPVVIFFAAVGWVRLWLTRRTVAAAILVFASTQLAFWMPNAIPDLEKHLLPLWIFVFLCVGPGYCTLDRLLVKRVKPRAPGFAAIRQRRVLRLATVLVLLAPSLVARVSNLTGLVAFDRACLTFHARGDPVRSKNLSLENLASLPHGAVVFADWSYGFNAIYRTRFELGRDDLVFLSDHHFDLDEAVRRYDSDPEKPVLFLSDPSNWLADDLNSRVEEMSPFWRLTP